LAFKRQATSDRSVVINARTAFGREALTGDKVPDEIGERLSSYVVR
jgi:hypothetical protein